jgi:heme-degrading monooxygenase HmoA
MLAVHRVPSLTQEAYEAVVHRLTGKSHADSPSDFPFEGLLVHAAGQTEEGFCVVDVWESEEAVERFREAIAPIAAEVGIEEPPEFFPAHTFVSTTR